MAFQSKDSVLNSYVPNLYNSDPDKVMRIWEELVAAKGNYEAHVEVVLKYTSVLGHKGMNYMILSLSRDEVPHYLRGENNTPQPQEEEDELAKFAWLKEFTT